MRRITRQHIEEYGEWQGPSRHDSSDDDHEVFRRNALETMPHYSVVGGRQRRAARVQQEELQSTIAEQQPAFDERAHESYESNEDVEDNNMEDEHMEEMLHDFFGAHVPHDRGEDNNEGNESTLQDAAKTPLYEGSQYSILRACLEILNLQTMYGWSNASVTSLLQ